MKKILLVLLQMTFFAGSCSWNALAERPAEGYTKDAQGRMLIYRASQKVAGIAGPLCMILGIAACGAVYADIIEKQDRLTMGLGGVCMVGVGAVGSWLWYDNYRHWDEPIIILSPHSISYRGIGILWRNVKNICLREVTVNGGAPSYFIDIKWYDLGEKKITSIQADLLAISHKKLDKHINCYFRNAQAGVSSYHKIDEKI